MERKSWQKKLNVDKWKKKNEKKKFSLLSSNQCKWNICCLVCLFSLRVFSFLSKFFLFGRSRSGRRKEAKEAKEAKKGGKGFNERARRRKKKCWIYYSHVLLYFCYSSVLIPGVCYVVVMAYDYDPWSLRSKLIWQWYVCMYVCINWTLIEQIVNYFSKKNSELITNKN